MLLRLPKEIILECCRFLSFNDIYRMRTIISPLRAIKDFHDRIIFIKNSFPKSLINAMGGLEAFISFPILEWKTNFSGPSGDIDRIRSTDVSESIMIGKDPYKRSFITLKLKRGAYIQEFVITLFQRFSEKSLWTQGKRDNWTFLENCSYFIINGQFKNDKLKKIISNLYQKKKSLLVELSIN